MQRDSDILHEPGDPKFQGGRIYSMLDMMGATATCDKCGRWQRIDALINLKEKAAEKGWTERAGQDLCPICSSS